MYLLEHVASLVLGFSCTLLALFPLLSSHVASSVGMVLSGTAHLLQRQKLYQVIWHFDSSNQNDQIY